MVVALFLVHGGWQTNIYALTPGDATNVSTLVSVKGLASDSHRDRIDLVDVFLQPLSETQYLYLKFFGKHREFVGADQLLEPGVPASQLIDQGYLEMSDSQTFAKVAALRALGWRVPASPAGAVVAGVVSDTPAARAQIAVGDEITTLDSKRVTGLCSLQAAMATVRPGTRVHITLRPGHFSHSGVLTRSAPRSLTLVAAASPDANALTGCPGTGRSGPSWLGVAAEDGTTYQLPGRITLNTANIGGPSAGLAMTLTLIDALSKGSLTGGHPIATTGTIDAAGNVGAIGGIAEKTIAVENAGIHYFFVPQSNYAVAKSVADPSLQVFGVSTLSQVLSELRHLGGADPVPLTSPTKP